MGFWSKVGGVINTVTTWAKEVAKPIANVVKKVGSWMRDVGEVTEAHLEGKDIIFEDNRNEKEINTIDYDRPDFNDEYADEQRHLLIKIEESKSEIEKISSQSDVRYNKLSLQIEVVELIIASQTFNRFAANIQLHESNLRIHHQTIQNSAGMLDEINRHRLGIKALMSQVNKVISSLDKAGINSSNCEKISNIDIDAKPGAVSIGRAYESFEEARSLLEKEATEYITLVDQQIKRAAQIQQIANNVPEKRNQISNWLDRKVLPQLRKSKRSTKDLLISIENIPKIEVQQRSTLESLAQEE